MTDSHLEHAQIDWTEDGQPLSAAFDDVYFSQHSGLEESRYVFIQHNQLSERFERHRCTQPFVVAETGFGTGLNFLACWQHFLAQAPAHAQLHFISVEKYPLCAADLQHALALWPELQPLSAELVAQYKVIQPGFQHFLFQQGRVRLTLLIGEASEQLSQLEARVDAWFLDGFAPSKNPQMWTPALFEQLARLATAGCTLATFTSAGFVRRGLIAAGFNMQRSPGYGRKREMLSGVLAHSPATAWSAAWFARPSPLPQHEKKALIIGAGISGCASAYSLALRGWQVTLIERRSDIAQEASGNPQGMLYVKLSAHHTALSQLILSGFGYSRRLLTHWPDNPHFSACGLLQLAYTDKEKQRQAQLAGAFNAQLLQPLTSHQASTLAGVTLNDSALFYPDSGWIKPAELCRVLLAHENISLITGQSAIQLDYQNLHWQVQGQSGFIAQAPVVIIANAQAANCFAQTRDLAIKPIQGQVSSLPATPASRQLNTVVSARGYVAPAHENQHCIGASFNFERLDTQLDPQVHLDNLKHLKDISPELYQQLNASQLQPEQLQGHAALRCTSPDYMPIVGPVADTQKLQQHYHLLRKNARAQLTTPCPYYPGLYVNTAQGSRGLITAPLAGELLAAWINNEALPVPKQLAEACHPNRFAIKHLMRNTPSAS